MELERLSPLAKQAAFLDAQGVRVHDIAAAVGVHEKSVSRWRHGSAYLAERDRWERYTLERLDPILQRLKVAAVHAAGVAIEQLLGILEQDDPDGLRTQAKLRSAEILVNSPVIRALVDARTERDSPQATASAVVQLVIRREAGTTTIEHGPVEEVTVEPPDADVAEEPERDTPPPYYSPLDS